MPDPETGEPINVSHMIPRSREDLARAAQALRQVAEYSVGLMGRTPDYMNVTYAGFAGRADEWAINGNEAGAERLVAYQKNLRRDDISLTHTIVQPTIDKATGDAPPPGNVHALHKVGETEHGIVVRGARVLATLAPFADELAVYPGRAAARRRRRLRAVVLHPDGRARPEVPVPRQLLGGRPKIRPSAVEPLRRAGRVRHLRQRRGAARPRVHRLPISPSTTR